MESIEVSAKTVEDAVLEAAIKLGTTRDKVSYEVVQQGSSGFLGIGSKKAIIKAHKKSDEEVEASLKAAREVEKIMERVNERAVKEETFAAAEPVKKEEKKAEKKPESKPESKPEKKQDKKPEQKLVQKAETKIESKDEAKTEAKAEDKAQAEVKPEQSNPEAVQPAEPQEPKVVTPLDTEPVKIFLDKVFAAMEMKVDIEVKADDQNREMIVDLEGEDMGVLIGKRGQTLDSLQYLTSLVANKNSDEYIRVKVDTENYRERRKATLENLAKNIAQKVKRNGKPVSLEPMNPYERRVIHSALQNDKYVCTHSEGEEPYRKVVVTLKEGVKVDRYNGNRNRNNNGRNNRGRYNRNYNGNKKKER